MKPRRKPTAHPPLPLGSKTIFGKVIGVLAISGERYYFLSAGKGDISMMNACAVEPQASGGKNG